MKSFVSALTFFVLFSSLAVIAQTTKTAPTPAAEPTPEAPAAAPPSTAAPATPEVPATTPAPVTPSDASQTTEPTTSQPAVAAPALTAPKTKMSGKRMLKAVYAVFEISQNDQTLGTIKTQLFIDKVPKTVESFIGLVEGTKPFSEFDPTKTKGATVTRPFYDGLTFHRVVPDYIIQGGCPLGTGKGGPGFSIPDEIRGDLRHESPGILSMANTGRKDSGGSQFFITLKGPLKHLDGKFTVFGKVVSGLDVAKAISLVKRNPISEKPIEPVVIKSVKIVREYIGP